MKTLPENPGAQTFGPISPAASAQLLRWLEAAAADGGAADLVPISPPEIPSDAAFRAWLGNSMARLEVSTRRAAREADLSPNVVGLYLREPGRSIYLRSAHKIMCNMRELAAAQDVALPALGGGHG